MGNRSALVGGLTCRLHATGQGAQGSAWVLLICKGRRAAPRAEVLRGAAAGDAVAAGATRCTVHAFVHFGPSKPVSTALVANTLLRPVGPLPGQ